MKKTLIILLVLFVTGIACKKIDNGGGLCACSPIIEPPLVLSIKNTVGTDLLNPKTSGAYSKSDIQFYQKDASGQASPLSFGIQEPFFFTDRKFEAYSLYLNVSIANRSGNNTFYLKLAEKEYALKAQFGQNNSVISALSIDEQPAVKEEKFTNVFYLTADAKSNPL